jgi:hypothetical protein
MTFTTPCFVRVENPEKRKELIEWLEGIGYRLEYLRNDGVIVLTSENRVYVYGEAVHEIIKSDYDTIDCGENTELFNALAAMTDGPECTEQYLMPTANLYILKRGKIKQLAAKGELLHNDVIVKCGGVFSSLRKAAAEEIVEYFKNKEL